MYLYNNEFNMLWEHVEKFEMNIMNIKYPKTFKKNCNQFFLIIKEVLKT
jgi:hypothetical protein